MKPCVGPRHRARPTAHRYHRQIAMVTNPAAIVSHLGQLADRQTMDVRDWKLSDKGNPTRFDGRPFNTHAAERIWTVEHDKINIVFGSRLHAFSHRADVSVRSTTDVLDVEHEHVDAAQHRRGRLPRRAVE